MSFKDLLLFSFVLCTLMSCSTEESPERKMHNGNASTISTGFKTFAAHGVTLSIPKGWKETEAEIPEAGMYLMVEKEGDDESGQFVASILNNKIMLDNYIEVMQEQLKSNFSLQEMAIEFTEMKSTEFNGMKALTCEFSHNSGGLNFQGVLKTFHCGEKTIYIFIQEEIEDIEKNKAGLDLLKKSFACS